MKKSRFSLRKRANSFRYAFNGIKLLINREHNAWIHCAVAICVVIAGFLLQISLSEWIAVTIVTGGVLAAEAINSAIETLCDLISTEYNQSIKQAKDLAAGAVLLTAIAAAITGIIIFAPKIGRLFG